MRARKPTTERMKQIYQEMFAEYRQAYPGCTKTDADIEAEYREWNRQVDARSRKGWA